VTPDVDGGHTFLFINDDVRGLQLVTLQFLRQLRACDGHISPWWRTAVSRRCTACQGDWWKL